MDLAATFIDYGGATLAPTMTSKSLRPVLSGNTTSIRPYVSSGLDNWRLAVQEHNGTWFKFICCKGHCPNAPSNVPSPVSGWTQLLYDVQADQFDMNELSAKHPDIMEKMRPLLPTSFSCGVTN